jgi:hypothetical protein
MILTRAMSGAIGRIGISPTRAEYLHQLLFELRVKVTGNDPIRGARQIRIRIPELLDF